MALLDAAFWFEIVDETRPISDIPEEVAKLTLDFLNAAASAEEIAYAVPLLDGWTKEPVHANAILTARGDGFTGLDRLSAVQGLGLARFVEIVRSIAKTDAPVQPAMFREMAPDRPIISASNTELKFEYELLLEGPLKGTRGTFPPPQQAQGFGSRGCTNASSCNLAPASFNQELNRFESQIEITGLMLDGDNGDTKVAIRMDHRLRPYDWMQPIDAGAEDFEFPAVMQLNNSMMIDLEIKATGQKFSLVARDVPCQVGRCVNWPPHLMTLYSTEPLVYYDAADPLGPPIVKIIDATTFLRGPENFLGLRPRINTYEFIKPETDRGLPAVKLQFDAPLGGEPVVIDHYLVQRSQDPSHGEASWSTVSGPWKQPQWIDPNPPPGALYYRVVPVMVDTFGQPYGGFAGQVLRVEPATSVFR